VIRVLAHKVRSIAQTTLSASKLTLLFFCVITSGFGQAPSPNPVRSVVYVAHDPDAIADYRTNPRVVHGMVDRLVMTATGQPTVAKAWASLVSPEDKVGVKISAAGGELFTTHHDVVNAIVDGLVAAGHPRDSIVVWDRSLGGTKAAGYQPSVDGYQLRAIAPREGYDPKAVFSAPLLGKLIWGDFEYVGSRGQSPLLSDTENTSSNGPKTSSCASGWKRSSPVTIAGVTNKPPTPSGVIAASLMLSAIPITKENPMAKAVNLTSPFLDSEDSCRRLHDNDVIAKDRRRRP